VAFFDLGQNGACENFANLLPIPSDRTGAEQMSEAVKWTVRRMNSLRGNRKSSRKRREGEEGLLATERQLVEVTKAAEIGELRLLTCRNYQITKHAH
jgi:hypothetical protein